MDSNMLPTLVPALLLLSGPHPGPDALRPEWIPADATVVAHLDSIRFEGEGRNFRASFRCDAEELADMLEANAERLDKRED